MPIISTFVGIIIRMYFGDHNPPHFHVEFQGEKATFNFAGQLLAGSISPRQRGNSYVTGLVVTDSNL
jgi:hypothetical protein